MASESLEKLLVLLREQVVDQTNHLWTDPERQSLADRTIEIVRGAVISVGEHDEEGICALLMASKCLTFIGHNLSKIYAGDLEAKLLAVKKIEGGA